MDVFPPQSDFVQAEVFIKARPGETTGETQNQREEERVLRREESLEEGMYGWVYRVVRGTANGILGSRFCLLLT